jgi:hypothetical protein
VERVELLLIAACIAHGLANKRPREDEPRGTQDVPAAWLVAQRTEFMVAQWMCYGG